MIEKLKKKNIKKAAKIYYAGIKMEIPPGRSSLEEIIKKLNKVETFVYKKKNQINGLVSFVIGKNKVKIDFICAMKLRKGVGKKLIKHLAIFSLRKKIKYIYSNVSSKDKRVIEFYDFCGFKRYGEKKIKLKKKFILYRIKAKPEWIKEALG
ncbi:MAG: GNAT family N-acetyltransferase [archaeon]